jgi:hypothetical protein
VDGGSNVIGDFMRRKTIILFTLCFVACFWLASCGKKQSPATAFDRIQGKWKLIEIGSDDNENGVIDGALELHPVSAEQNNERQFNKDGTGIETDTWPGKVPFSLAFKWQIIKGDSVTMYYAANDTLTYLLLNVSSTNLALLAYGNTSIEEYYYAKK